jgi:hypothetical protein
MTIPVVRLHDDVPPRARLRLPTVSSAVCRCGAVYDNGNVAVPTEYSGLCGHCAFKRGMRLGDSLHVAATPGVQIVSSAA